MLIHIQCPLKSGTLDTYRTLKVPYAKKIDFKYAK